MSGRFTAGISYTPALGPAIALELGQVDANGTTWIVNDATGMGGPDTSGHVVQQSGDHGGWASPQFYGSRLMTLTVTALATSQALRDVARAQMQQAVPVSDLALLRWDEPVPKQMLVRRSGPLPETEVADADVRFQIGLIAPDPRKYSTVLHQLTANQGPGPAGLAPPYTPPLTLPAGAGPMSVSVSNAGSFETRPLVTITGPMSAPGVVNQTTGQRVTFSTLTLGASDVLVMDFLNKQATLNGAYRAADISSSWWLLPPGTTGVQLTGTGASGAAMTVAWRDAWI